MGAKFDKWPGMKTNVPKFQLPLSSVWDQPCMGGDSKNNNNKKQPTNQKPRQEHKQELKDIFTGGTTKFAYIIDVPQPTHIISAILEFNELIYRWDYISWFNIIFKP